MARFVFRLEPVLQVREIREEAAQQALAEVEQARAAAQRRLDGTRRAISATLRAPREAAVDVLAYQYREHYREALVRREAVEKAALADRSRVVAQKRDDLIAAMQEKRVLERLREKREAEFWSRESARQTRELDETGLMTFRFQSMAKGGE